MFTATLTNTLIMAQVVLGATLTGLGASNANGILVTIFGAANTVIAGMIAFLKSRGQPMRARMFRDDLERVVDEIENSATMWLGISRGSHGYDAIDTDDQVTVRSEVARLTRLYDKAVKTNTLNDPDMYSTGAPGDPYSAAMRNKAAAAAPVPAAAAAPTPAATAPVDAAPAEAPVVQAAEDASPASKAPDPEPTASNLPVKELVAEASASTSQEASKESAAQSDSAKIAASEQTSSEPVAKPDEQAKKPEVVPQPSQLAAPAADPDESPASAAHPAAHASS